MNKLIKSVENTVDRLILISDKNRFISLNHKPKNENEEPISPELFRKLKFTSIEVLTDKKMIEDFPDGLLSSQFILINPKSIENFIIYNDDMPFEEQLLKEQELKNIIVQLLEKSLHKNDTDDDQLIKLVSIYNKNESELMKTLSFDRNQLKKLNKYIENDGNIMTIFKSEELFQIHSYPRSEKKYPIKLFKGEQYTQTIQNEMKKFLTYYETTQDNELKEYLCSGFAAKIFSQIKNFRHSTNLRNWEFIADGANLEKFPNTIHKIHGLPSLSNELREKIAKAVEPLTNQNIERHILITGISSYSQIIGRNGTFSNILQHPIKQDESISKKLSSKPSINRK